MNASDRPTAFWKLVNPREVCSLDDIIELHVQDS